MFIVMVEHFEMGHYVNGSIETFGNVTDASVSSKWIPAIAAWLEQKQGKSLHSIETQQRV